MKHAWSVAVAGFACALTLSLSAQAYPPAAGQAPATPGSQKTSDAKKVTVSGCLERGSASANPTGTTGAPAGTPAAGAASASATFVLNTAAAGSAAAGTTGTAGTASSYTLAGDEAKLSPHVGHKIEITGTVEDRPMSDKASETATTATKKAPKLTVETVKMISASCTP